MQQKMNAQKRAENETEGGEDTSDGDSNAN